MYMYTHVSVMFLIDNIVIDTCILCTLIFVQITISKKLWLIFKEMFLIA